MSLESPSLLPLLLLVPLALGGYVLLGRRRRRYAVRFSNLELAAGVVERSAAWRRHVPPALFLLALTALLLALARPHATLSVPRERATVILAMDSSGSMTATDVAPSRLVASRRAARSFLETLPKQIRAGVVGFSGEAWVAAPPSRDRAAASAALDTLLPGRGTAIGDAIGRSLEVGRESLDAEGARGRDRGASRDGESPLAVLLLSDGAQRGGILQPLEGAERARHMRVPVYTVALGTAEGTIRFGPPGYRTEIPAPPDPVTLRQVARVTGGEFYAVRDGTRLEAVYKDLGSRLGRERKRTEVTVGFVAGGALFLAAAGFLSQAVRRLP